MGIVKSISNSFVIQDRNTVEDTPLEFLLVPSSNIEWRRRCRATGAFLSYQDMCEMAVRQLQCEWKFKSFLIR